MMEPSQMQVATISRQLARISLDRNSSNNSATGLSKMQDGEATDSTVEQPGDTRSYMLEASAWEYALTAQSCAYLALELQGFAEKLSRSRITCRESTYRQLSDSTVTFRRLLEDMSKSYAEYNASEDDHYIPVLSSRVVEAIRCTLAAGEAPTLGGSTTNA
jgi:hypothetical protein